MKNIIVILLITLVAQNVNSQLLKEIQHPDIAGLIFRKPKISGYAIQGSPYIVSKFEPVKVVNIIEQALMRYNVFKDEFEFISTKSDTLILDKIADFNNLNFVATNTKYKLLNYLNLDDKYQFGYLITVYEKGNFGLFKKENITLTEEKIAKTSLEKDMPAKYYQTGNTYFLKYNDKIQEFPSNKKRLVKIFPDKKEAIETFVKENKIDFDKDVDKIKVVDFLTSM